jgi:hypothetical protein
MIKKGKKAEKVLAQKKEDGDPSSFPRILSCDSRVSAQKRCFAERGRLSR